MRKILLVCGSLLLAAGAFMGVVNASPTTSVSQTISAGTLSTDILDSSRVAVGSPSLAMSAQTFSFSCLNGGSSSTGSLGTNAQRIYAINPGASNTGFTVDIAGSATTALWTSGGNTYDFNDAGTSGCSDGADADTKAGQLTVNPSASTINLDCGSCTTTGITKGASTAFLEGTTDSINLINAGSTSDDFLRVYLTGISLSQTIPAEQPTGTYTANFTVSITAQ